MLSEAVAIFTAKATDKLRQHGLATHLITVILGADRYAPNAEPKTISTVVHLPGATNDLTALPQAALRGLR